MRASELENWTLGDLGIALEGYSLAAEEALSRGFGVGEPLGAEWEEGVAIIERKKERKKEKKKKIVDGG